MKKLLLLLSLAVVTLGMSSCCSMFGSIASNANYIEETVQKKTCGYDIVREEVVIDAKSGLTEIRETKVPRYKEVVVRTKVPCPDCTRYYCPKQGCCGSDTSYLRKMATAQPATGSPFIGLIPTMKKIAPEP